MLSVRSLRVDYGHVQALRGVDLEAREGEITAIIGSNGAGKTSTLMAISGLAPVTEGEILLRGSPITGRPAHHTGEVTTVALDRGAVHIARASYLSDAFGIGAAGSLPCFAAAQIAVESLATIEPYLAAVGLSSRRVRLKSEGSALAVALPAAFGGTMLFHTA